MSFLLVLMSLLLMMANTLSHDLNPIIYVWSRVSSSRGCHFDGWFHNHDRGHWRRAGQNWADKRHPGTEGIGAEIHVGPASSTFNFRPNKTMKPCCFLRDWILTHSDDIWPEMIIHVRCPTAPAHTAELWCSGIWILSDSVSRRSAELTWNPFKRTCYDMQVVCFLW